jgi:hypothetical protein
MEADSPRQGDNLMCQYCSEDHGFWDDIVDRGKRIRILTDAEVKALNLPVEQVKMQDRSDVSTNDPMPL